MTTAVECGAGHDPDLVRPTGHLRLEPALVSIAGPRPDNQDAGTAGPSLIAVADGVGGNVGGAIASTVVVEAVRTAMQDASGPSNDRLSRAVESANEQLGRAVAADPGLAGMATTLTAVALEQGSLTIAHVGDTRAYVLRNGRLCRLTRDQTVVQSLVDAGLVDEADLGTHPMRSVLLGALHGRADDAQHLDVTTVPVFAGDRILVCSDGLTGVVGPDLIERVLREEARPEEAAARLVKDALAAATHDNVTVVVADVACSGAFFARPPISYDAVTPS
jgi:PPM family protein phosphatase